MRLVGFHGENRVDGPMEHNDSPIKIDLDDGVIRDPGGFTLIEMIFSLVLLGIIGVVGAMFIVRSMEGYVMVRANTEMTQKAQSAFARLSLEFENLVDVRTWSQGGSSITYSMRPRSVEPDVVRSLSLVNGQIKLIDGATLPTQSTGSTLMDGVTSLQLNYFTVSTGGATSNWDGNLKNLYAFELRMVLGATSSFGAPVTLTALVTPRKSGHWDGPTDWNR